MYGIQAITVTDYFCTCNSTGITKCCNFLHLDEWWTVPHTS